MLYDKRRRNQKQINVPPKIWFFIAVLSTLSNSTFGQINGEYEQGLQYLEKHQLTAQALGPGVHYEAGIIDPISFSTGFSPGLSTHQAGSGLGYALQSRIRLYHNQNRRKLLGKTISGNSGNYVAFANSVFFGDLQITGNFKAPEDFTIYFNGGLYGVQRTYRRGFNFQTELGLGYYQGSGMEDSFGVLFNLSFGWVFTNRR